MSVSNYKNLREGYLDNTKNLRERYLDTTPQYYITFFS
jgi:hypothetical protein